MAWQNVSSKRLIQSNRVYRVVKFEVDKKKLLMFRLFVQIIRNTKFFFIWRRLLTGFGSLPLNSNTYLTNYNYYFNLEFVVITIGVFRHFEIIITYKSLIMIGFINLSVARGLLVCSLFPGIAAKRSSESRQHSKGGSWLIISLSDLPQGPTSETFSTSNSRWEFPTQFFLQT